jgi:release factor glutamine methyltransferase
MDDVLEQRTQAGAARNGQAAATVRDAQRAATERFRAVESETPRLDADLLLAHALGCDRAALYVEPERPLSPADLTRYEELVRRRETREPVAYITGRKAFRYIELHIDERVLVPRPETELLVDIAIELPRAARVVDVGTGSGVVALSLKHERPDLQVVGVDFDENALAVARDNRDRLGLDLDFRHSDLLESVDWEVDAVVANLPYIDPDELPDLYPELRAEPKTATLAEEHGLALIRRLVSQAEAVPMLVLEVGREQAKAVRDIVKTGGFTEVETYWDLAGIERAVVGRRR